LILENVSYLTKEFHEGAIKFAHPDLIDFREGSMDKGPQMSSNKLLPVAK